MKKLKLMTIIGTRPEIIRLSEVIKLADTAFEHVLVHTGQNYDHELSQLFFNELELRKPDEYLSCSADSLGETVGNIIAKSYEVIQQHKPDALLILGDTNSCLSAYAAKRLKVPIFHMEAGNRCFDQNVPEEINRKVVDVISDVNLAYTEHSRRYLLNEGARKEHTFVTGSPMPEVLMKNKDKISQSNVLEKLSLETGKFILISAHREENIDNEINFTSLMSTINAISEQHHMPVIYSLHPRSKKMIQERNFKFHENVREFKPFGFLDYNALQSNAYAVLSDSGTLSEESAILNFPAVLIRTSTERPEAIDKGSIVLGGITPETILPAISVAKMDSHEQRNYTLPNDYIDHNVSTKVIRIIQGYTSIINDTIWRK
jgi:UDP-N-acetylglucosamine 2-epimerase